jgi:alkaline phosphatase
MKQIKRSIILLSMVCFLPTALYAFPDTIILVIGDGMGFSHLYASEMLNGVAFLNEFQTVGFLRNDTFTSRMTDSAAAATAIFGGKKTYPSFLGMDENGTALETVFDTFKKHGWQTAMITNTRFYDATSAAAYAHALRTEVSVIEEYFVNTEIDLFCAGGFESFINPFTGKIKKNNPLSLLQNSGYDIYRPGFEIVIQHNGNYNGSVLFTSNGDNDFENLSEVSFLEIVTFSLSLLNKRPLFLVIESGRIDDASHINDTEAAKSELRVLGEILVYLLEKYPDALILLTADHETGGFSVTAEYGEEPIISWCSSDHTCSLVPLLAKGQGHDAFGGVYHLSELPRKILTVGGIYE